MGSQNSVLAIGTFQNAHYCQECYKSCLQNSIAVFILFKKCMLLSQCTHLFFSVPLKIPVIKTVTVKKYNIINNHSVHEFLEELQIKLQNDNTSARLRCFVKYYQHRWGSVMQENTKYFRKVLKINKIDLRNKTLP